MKNFIIPLAMIGLSLGVAALTGCREDDCPAPSPTTKPTSPSVVGRWELTRTSGGITGRDQPADPARKQEIIFRTDGQVEFLTNGITTSTMPYAPRQDTAYTTRQSQTFLFGFTFIGQISATNLTLVEDAADGFTSEYVRRAN